MSVRTTIDMPDEVYDTLRRKAAEEHTSIRALVVEAINERYRRPKKGKRVIAPLIPGKGKPGPDAPDRENPYDILFA
jgi:hypothetical protein